MFEKAPTGIISRSAMLLLISHGALILVLIMDSLPKRGDGPVILPTATPTLVARAAYSTGAFEEERQTLDKSSYDLQEKG